jgi:single-strand DNA-binding protein
MSGDVNVTLVGTTGGPSELRFLPSGVAVCNVSLAVTPRRFDKQANAWTDQPTQWYRVSAWREMAEQVAETVIDKGMRIVVVGTLNPREFEQNGVKRMALEVDADEVAVSLKYATAKVTKAQRADSGASRQPGAQQGGPRPAEDPWGGSQASGGGFGGEQSNPPF